MCIVFKPGLPEMLDTFKVESSVVIVVVLLRALEISRVTVALSASFLRWASALLWAEESFQSPAWLYPISKCGKNGDASEGDSTELIVNQSQKAIAANATTPFKLQCHSQGTSHAMQRTPYQNIFFVKETMTYLADYFVWVWGSCIVKLDPRANLLSFGFVMVSELYFFLTSSSLL